MAGDEHRTEVLRALRQLCGKSVQSVSAQTQPRQSLGISALDALLPGGGVESGSLVEWLAPSDGSGAAILALQGVRLALGQHLVWAVVDFASEFHPPAVCGWGVSLDSLLLLRPTSVADAIWAVEQCLRCPAVGVTWFSSEQLPDRVVQRWKRAVEVGGGMGVLFRPVEANRRASWADVRWHVQSQPDVGVVEGDVRESSVGRHAVAGRVIRVELVSCRGCFAGGGVDLELHDATGDVRVVSAVADPATSGCSA